MSLPLPGFRATLSYHLFLITSFFYLPYATQKRIESFFLRGDQWLYTGRRGAASGGSGRSCEHASSKGSIRRKRHARTKS